VLSILRVCGDISGLLVLRSHVVRVNLLTSYGLHSWETEDVRQILFRLLEQMSEAANLCVWLWIYSLFRMMTLVLNKVPLVDGA